MAGAQSHDQAAKVSLTFPVQHPWVARETCKPRCTAAQPSPSATCIQLPVAMWHCLCRYEKISEKKMSTPIEVLCKGYPMEFVTYFQYCRSLRFDDKPDYSYLRKMFRDLFAREGRSWAFRDFAPRCAGEGSRREGRATLEGALIVGYLCTGYGHQILRSNIPSLVSPAVCSTHPGYQWDYVFDWTILKHQQSGTVPRPQVAPRPDAAGGEQEEAQDPNYGGR